MNVKQIRLSAVGAAAAVGVAGALLIPGVAWAEPAGCSSAVSGGSSSTGLLSATGTGSCSGAATRTLRVEIKQDKPLGQPDPLTASNSDYGTKTSYRASVSTCDGGRNANYYGRAFFTSNSTYHDTASTRVQTC